MWLLIIFVVFVVWLCSGAEWTKIPGFGKVLAQSAVNQITLQDSQDLEDYDLDWTCVGPRRFFIRRAIRECIRCSKCKKYIEFDNSIDPLTFCKHCIAEHEMLSLMSQKTTEEMYLLEDSVLENEMAYEEPCRDKSLLN